MDMSGDQAAGLRRLFGARAPQVVAFVAGRPANGRTTLIVQSAAALASAGHGVVIVDENPGLDNAAAAFGVEERNDFRDAVEGRCSLRQAMLHAAPQIRILPAAAAARELDLAHGERLRRFAQCLHDLQHGADFVLVDCALRSDSRLSALALTARHVAVVAAANTESVANAFNLVGQMLGNCGRDNYHVVVTRARSRDEAQNIFQNMKRAARDHLGVHLDFLGASTAANSEHIADGLLTRLPQGRAVPSSSGFVLPSIAANAPGGVMV